MLQPKNSILRWPFQTIPAHGLKPWLLQKLLQLLLRIGNTASYWTLWVEVRGARSCGRITRAARKWAMSRASSLVYEPLFLKGEIGKKWFEDLPRDPFQSVTPLRKLTVK